MTPRPAIDIRDLTRVLMSGTVAYVAVHFLLLPYLVRLGVSFPTYFYLGVIATGALSVVISLATRSLTQSPATEPDLHPAE